MSSKHDPTALPRKSGIILAARLVACYRWLDTGLVLVAGLDQVLKSQTTVRTRAEVERIVMLSTSTNLVGLSLAPPSLALQLIPHFVPHVYQ